MELQWVGGTEICSPYLDNMTGMTATPIDGKNPFKIFSGANGPIALGLGMQYWGYRPNKFQK